VLFNNVFNGGLFAGSVGSKKKATAVSGGLTPLRPAILMKNPD
jgi:hypothetical protein